MHNNSFASPHYQHQTHVTNAGPTTTNTLNNSCNNNNSSANGKNSSNNLELSRTPSSSDMTSLNAQRQFMPPQQQAPSGQGIKLSFSHYKPPPAHKKWYTSTPLWYSCIAVIIGWRCIVSWTTKGLLLRGGGGGGGGELLQTCRNKATVYYLLQLGWYRVSIIFKNVILNVN